MPTLADGEGLPPHAAAPLSKWGDHALSPELAAKRTHPPAAAAANGNGHGLGGAVQLLNPVDP